MTDVRVQRNEEAGRFEAYVDEVVAGFVVYRSHDGAVELVHTEVDDAFEGHGVGSTLARQTLDLLRSEGVQVIPSCPFVASWIDRHPDYADLVA